MKKFLALVLALVMTMSLVTVSAGAKDFTDDESLNYEEAVAVMSEIGVIDGYTDGSFKPQNGLTRGAAAKIICNMILGPTTAAALRADTAPFKDVAVDNQYAGYIAYCVQQGITSGYTDGTYRPAAPLTSFAFMKMLLGALGYDAEIEGYVGANCFINVAKQAIGIGLDAGLTEDFDGGKQITREEAALFAFNTLKADLVEYETKITSTVNGQTVTIGNSAAKAMTWKNSATRKNNIKADNYVQFAEQYFTKLELENTTDAFGRPARVWSFKGEEIGTYVNRDLLVETYTAKVTGKDLYELLGKTVIADYDFAIYVDGETEKAVLGDAYFTAGNLVKTNTDKVGETGDGVLTEVYVDTDAKEVTIAIINTYLAKANSDYDSKKEVAEFSIWGIEQVRKNQLVKNTAKSDVDLKVSAEDFDVEDIEKNDIVLVNIAEGNIQVITEIETLADVEITAFKQGSNLTVDGTKYGYASTACYDGDALKVYTNDTDPTINLKDTTYNVYLDVYGNVIGVEEVDPAENFLFVTGFDGRTSNLVNKTYEFAAIFMDGTMKTIEVDAKKSDEAIFEADHPALVNTWCSYTVNDDGVYTLKVAELQSAQDAARGNITINKKNVSLDGKGGTSFAKVYGNDDTIYLNVSLYNINDTQNSGKLVSIIDDVESVTTGIKNTDLVVGNVTAATVDENDANDVANCPTNEVYTLYKSNGYITAAIVIGEDQGVSSNYAYVTSGDVKLESYDKTSKLHTWTREVVIDGEVTEITYVDTAIDVIDSTSMEQGKWYKVTYYANGSVKSAEDLTTKLTNADKDDGFINAVTDVQTAVNGSKDTVLMRVNFTGVTCDPTYKNGTLYTDTAATKGFSVSPDVKVVLCNANGAGKAFSTVDDTFAGYEGLEDAIEELNAKPFHGTLSAILKGGVATVVIFNCTDADTGFNAGSETDTSDTYKVSLAVASGKVTLTVTGLKAAAAQNFTWTATATNTNSGYVQTLESAAPVAAPTAEDGTATDDIASALNGLVVYQVTVTFADGTVLTTNTVMG